MKKYMLLIVVLILALVGCSSNNGNSEEAANNAGDNSDYPNQPIKLIIPFSPGGDTDSNGRLVAKYLQEELGVKVVPTNVTGSAGSVATEEVHSSKADGYTLLWHHNAFLINEITGVSKYGYKDFVSLGIPVMDQTNLFAVRGDSEFDTLEEFVEAAKENPGGLSVASGIGNYSHYLYEDFMKKTGTDVVLVDAGGGTEQKAELLSGRLDLLYSTYQQVQSEIEAGDIKVLGFMSEERHPDIPEIPTFKEQGVDMVHDKFFTLQAPEGTPQEIVDTLADAMAKLQDNPEYKEAFDKLFVSSDYMEPEDSVEFIESEFNNYSAFESVLKGE